MQSQNTQSNELNSTPNSYFAILTSDVIQSNQISIHAKFLFAIITSLTQQEGYCWASNKYFAEICKVEERSVQRWIKELKENNFIHVEISDDGSFHPRKIFPILNSRNIKQKSEVCKRPPDKNVMGGDDTNVIHNNKAINTKASLKKEANKKEIKKLSAQSMSLKNSLPSYEGSFSLEGLPAPIREFLMQHNRHYHLIRPKILARWLKNYGPDEVLCSLKMLFSKMKTQKKPISNPESWMEAALRDKYAEKASLCKENLQNAIAFSQQYPEIKLKINTRYCTHERSQKDFYYNLPKETFHEGLESLLNF